MSGDYIIADLSQGGGPKEVSKCHINWFRDDFRRVLWPPTRNLTETKLNAFLRSAASPSCEWPIYDAVIRYRFATLGEMNNFMRHHQVELSSAAEDNTTASNSQPQTGRTKRASKRPIRFSPDVHSSASHRSRVIEEEQNCLVEE